MKSKKLLKVLAMVLAGTIPASLAAGCMGLGGGDGNGTTLVVKYYDGAYGKAWMETAANDFIAAKKAAGVDIAAIRMVGDTDINQSVVNELNAGTGLADIYMVQSGPWTDWVTNGKLADLTSVYETEVDTSAGKQKIKNYLEDGFDIQYYSQRQANVGNYMPWAMPWSMSQIGLVYNEKMLQDVGYDVPPTTVAELSDCCAKLVAAGKTPFVFPGNESHWLRYIIQVWWAQYQGVYEENELNNITESEGSFYDYWNMTEVDVLNQRGIQEGIDTLQSLFVDTTAKTWKNVSSKVPSYYVKQAEQAFVQGEAAMLIGASFMYSEVKDYVKDGDVFKMMSMPTIENAAKNADGSTMSINYYTSEDFMVVPAAATNKDLAKEFLAFLSNEKYLLDFTQKTGTLRPFSYDEAKLNALNMNTFNKSVLDVYNNSDVHLVSLPANISKPEDRSLITLYHNMQINGAWDWGTFAGRLKTDTSANIMRDVLTDTTDDFEDWKNKLGLLG